MRRLIPIDLFTDGACPNNGKVRGGAPMGAGIVGRTPRFEREWAIPLGPGTNQRAELLAVREALRKVKDLPGSSVRVHTDSEYAIGCLTRAWKVKANQELVEEIKQLIAACGSYRMIKVAGHAGHPENERADQLATRAALTGEYYSGLVRAPAQDGGEARDGGQDDE